MVTLYNKKAYEGRMVKGYEHVYKGRMVNGCKKVYKGRRVEGYKNVLRQNGKRVLKKNV